MSRRRRILVLCPYPQGVAAGQRLKYEQYLDDWRAAGYEVDVSSFADMRLWNVLYEPGHMTGKVVGTFKGYARRFRDLPRIRAYDIVYIFMWATPIGPPLAERVVRRLAKLIIFDIEDNVLIGTTVKEHPNPILAFLKGPAKMRYLVRVADHVITSSPFLNDFCMGINKRKACTYISSSVNTERFVPRAREKKSGPPVIGWTGTFSSKMFLDLLRPVFVRLAERVRFRLKVIGNFDYSLEGVDLEVVRWNKDTEVEDLQSFDIGVYPLNLDDWVLGKSGLKAIQYMASGLPTVATNVGTTPLLIRHGENGFLVRTEDEWVDSLERLLRDPTLRHRLGAAAREDAVAKYSTHAIAVQYRRVLDSVLG